MKNLSSKLKGMGMELLNSQIDNLYPHAKKVAELGIDIKVEKDFGVNQIHVNCARLFCELVEYRNSL